MNELMGRLVRAVYLNDDATHLQFDTDSGPLAYCAEADCCSESWFNHIAGLDALRERVLQVEEVPVVVVIEGEPGYSARQEVDEVYGFKLYTLRGICDIELRNASNGYYGGYAGSTKPLPTDQLRPIVEDF